MPGTANLLAWEFLLNRLAWEFLPNRLAWELLLKTNLLLTPSLAQTGPTAWHGTGQRNADEWGPNGWRADGWRADEWRADEWRADEWRADGWRADGWRAGRWDTDEFDMCHRLPGVSNMAAAALAVSVPR
jgi:hypothetical protein